jgi:hypothetical protein
MANAADYLRLDTTQLLNTYKLRTRSITPSSFVATNIAPNYRLSVTIIPTIDSALVTPSVFTLQPNESITVTVAYNTAELELLSAGTLIGALDMSVSAIATTVPETPAAPPPPPLPPAPRQIISRVQITPTNFTFNEVNESRQIAAQLFVDDVVVPATFTWSLENDTGQAFRINETSGIVRALKPGINIAQVKARVVTPGEYSQTVGISNVATNIPVVGGVTGNLVVTVLGLPPNIDARVSISDLAEDNFVLQVGSSRTFTNVPVGTYTIAPSVVTSGGENYNPSGGGRINVNPGTNEFIITYTRQEISEYTINIVALLDSVGRPIPPNATLRIGDRFTVRAETLRNNILSFVGPIQFNATNTVEASIRSEEAGGGVGGEAIVAAEPVASSFQQGIAEATFTVSNSGQVEISAINTTAGSATRVLQVRPRQNYTIRMVSSPNIIPGQCVELSATVLVAGIPTGIPVELTLSGTAPARISNIPCAETAPRPPQGGQISTPAPVEEEDINQFFQSVENQTENEQQQE